LNPELYILGSSSATPTRERNPTSQILKIGSEKIMIDCGEGTQMRLMQFGIRQTGIDYICISHLHGDHYFGLIGLISTMSLMGRKQMLHIIGPAPLKNILDLQILHGGMHIHFEIKFHPTNPNVPEFILKTQSFELSSFPLKHRIHCTGFLIKEGKKERHLNMQAIEALKIPVAYYKSIKTGKNYSAENGTEILNTELTFDPTPIKSYAYCSDTIFDPTIVPFIKDVNLLYHETTYLHNLAQKAAERFHSTAKEAGIIAKMANVGKLLIGHFSSRYDNLQPFLEEAITEFTPTELAIEGSKIEL
jgi:ribonuclease Z